MAIELRMKGTDALVKPCDKYITCLGEEFVVARILPPNYKTGGAAVLSTMGKVYLPSEYGAYCTTV